MTREIMRFVSWIVLLLPFAPTLPGQNEGHDQGYDHVAIGAYDPDSWNGIVFDAEANGQRIPFGLRIGSKSGTFLDGSRIYPAVSLVGPHAPDGSYAQIGWRHTPRAATVILEWSRTGPTTVVGRITAPPDVQLVLETYSPDTPYFTGTYHVDAKGSRIVGEHFLDSLFASTSHFVVAIDRPIRGSGTFSDIGQLEKVMDAGELAEPLEGEVGRAAGLQFADDKRYLKGAAGLEFSTASDGVAHFVASMGWDLAAISSEEREALAPHKIDTILEATATAYKDTRPRLTGLFDGAADPIGNSMFWNTLYIRSLDLEFPSISRSWAHGFGGWVVGEWDCFFGSLLTSVEDPAQTSAAVRAILLAQTQTGVVPNVDGASGISPDRSQPPIGSYVVWKNYERNTDLELLKWAYPRLKLWHEWWFADRGDGQPYRDGNRDGLLEWGSDRGATASVGGRGFLQHAKWESGMDDSPMYDDVDFNPTTYTMELDDVGLNSLFALDAECLSRIASILGIESDSRRFEDEYQRVKARVQSRLWNERDGIFENRYWDGRFSSTLSPTNFYPLIAGIATADQAHRMVREHLTNPDEFWGEYVIPTVSRREPSFHDQYYWRGDIWGPTNYLVSEGLDRYGEDAVALEFAQKSYALFMDDWLRNQRTNEQYYAWGGSAGGDTHYTWGALLCLIAMEQYLNENPWDGFRFGALSPPKEGQLTNIAWNQHHYDVSVGPAITSLKRDGRLVFHADAGVVVRNYRVEPTRLSFSITTSRSTAIQVMELQPGQVQVRIDDAVVNHRQSQDRSISLSVPVGRHQISLEQK
jgi:Trehalase